MASSSSSGMEAWLISSNEALELKLVRAEKDIKWFRSSTHENGKTIEAEEVEEGDEDEEERSQPLTDEDLIAPFHAKFTYPIFGEKEMVFGYKGLKIELSFASSSLRQYLNVTYRSQIESTALQADDVEKKLYGFIPSDYTKNQETFDKWVDDDAYSFKPFGKLVERYRAADAEDGENEVEYEIYHCTFNTPGFREYHRRMQLFILLYIEGGSYIQEDEESWEFLVLFEKRTHPSTDPSSSTTSADRISSYHFVGYVSAYPFWCYPEHVRLRLSQFVITPPFQGQGHGSQLYNALYDYALRLPSCLELTIEDPSEEFEDLRDRNDLKRLIQSEKAIADCEEIESGAPVDKAWVEKVRREGKYAKRQFERLIEMLLLRKLDKNDSKAHRAFRLQVKERLYHFNYTLLCQIDKEERKEKLKETFENVQEGYEEMLESVEGGPPFRWVKIPVE